MFDILKRKVKKIVGDEPLEIGELSYSFNHQVLILQNHLKLANVGFGVPHPTFELGEQILDRWISVMIDAKDKEK